MNPAQVWLQDGLACTELVTLNFRNNYGIYNAK
jgi:hypothetical protein